MSIEQIARGIKAEQIVEARQKAKLAQEALPDRILEGMVSVLREGDKELFLQRAKRFRARNVNEILGARHLAEKGLLRHHGQLQDAKEKNEKSLSEIAAITDTAKTLKELLLALPDLSNPSGSSMRGLALHLEGYIYESTVIGEAENRLEAWAGLINLLDYHLPVFERIQATLEGKKRKGKPLSVGTLELFIEVIAKMYQEITKRKFTVNKHNEKDYYPEGVCFAEKAISILSVPAYSAHSKYKKFLSSTRYTDESFQSACKHVRTALKKTGGN
jgi:hypothetical protein